MDESRWKHCKIDINSVKALTQTKAGVYETNRLQVVTKGGRPSRLEWASSISVPVPNIMLSWQITLGHVLTLTFSPTDPMGPTPPGGP